jgi:hypothetical protein
VDFFCEGVAEFGEESRGGLRIWNHEEFVGFQKYIKNGYL